MENRFANTGLKVGDHFTFRKGDRNIFTVLSTTKYAAVVSNGKERCLHIRTSAQIWNRIKAGVTHG